LVFYQRILLLFSVADNQDTVEIHVLQGEREMAGDNKTLGRFTLSGLPPAPRGVPQVEVSFDIDANGILHVKAVDKATSKEQSITIKSSSGLSEDEIDKMKKDAEVHADEDKKKKEEVEVRNNAETIVAHTEKFIKENKDKLKDDDKKKMEEKMEAIKKVKDSKDLEPIKAAVKDMEDTVQAIGAAMYQEQAQAQQGAPGASGPSTEGKKTEDAKADDKKTDKDAVEGDFEEVKDENKKEDKS